MRINTRGLIIRDTAVKNEDRLVTVLTPDLGVIRAFVRRARRLKGNSAAATQLLGYSELTLFCNRDTYTIDEADPIDIFLNCAPISSVCRSHSIFVKCAAFSELRASGLRRS